MTDDEITAIVGWPTETEMAKYRKVAATAEAAERERCTEWLSNQRNETPATGRELAQAMRFSLNA